MDSYNRYNKKVNNMKKRHLSRLSLLFLVFSIVSCSGVRYNAKLFDDAENDLGKEFVMANKLNLSSKDANNKRLIIFPVTNVESYHSVFVANYEMEVDFGKQFIIVFSFVSVYKKNHYLKSVDLKDGQLTISCYCKSSLIATGSACSPYQRWCFVKMDVVDYTSISFTGE